MVKVNQILNSLKQMKQPRSAWNRAVREDAIAIISNLIDDGKDCEVKSEKHLESLMLRGAENWKRYSEGCHGVAVPSDVQIAEHYCNNSELKMTKGGLKRPNSRETWIQVQERGLRQSYFLCREIYYKLMEVK
jgi:hypothetical protein